MFIIYDVAQNVLEKCCSSQCFWILLSTVCVNPAFSLLYGLQDQLRRERGISTEGDICSAAGLDARHIGGHAWRDRGSIESQLHSTQWKHRMSRWVTVLFLNGVGLSLHRFCLNSFLLIPTETAFHGSPLNRPLPPSLIASFLIPAAIFLFPVW